MTNAVKIYILIIQTTITYSKLHIYRIMISNTLDKLIITCELKARVNGSKRNAVQFQI